MVTKTSPIGVIDSGIGGFSVALKMQQMLPHENLLYFGDGGNMPYGNHTADEILTMTRYMLRFMEERGVKALLVACNTISCLSVKNVGVISTCFTESTRCYPNLIGQKAPDKTVISHGCPDLAKLVEANLGDPKGQEVIEEDLKKNMDELVHKHKIDCCVLGCTHYPLVSVPGAAPGGPGGPDGQDNRGVHGGEGPDQRPAWTGHPGHLHHRLGGGVPGEGRQGGPEGDLRTGLPHFQAVSKSLRAPAAAPDRQDRRGGLLSSASGHVPGGAGI